jgi:hypothetical protein
MDNLLACPWDHKAGMGLKLALAVADVQQGHNLVIE